MILKQKSFLWPITFSLCLTAFSCTAIDIYEKNTVIPKHVWKNSFQPSFAFTIKDTTVAYQLFLVLRHTEKYHFTNIYINLLTKQPGQDSMQKIRFDLTLADNEKGWLASGMDDIYEHRIPLTPQGQDFYFKKAGDYIFSVEQIMREDPLQNVLSVGLRIEKKQ